MVKMYIGNCTNKVQDFMYRLPESEKLAVQPIPIGGQVKIAQTRGGDLTTLDVEAIIRQHAPYGMVCVDEIDRTKEFIGLCYSLDKPVSPDKLRRGVERNATVLDAMGRQLRQEAAVAIHNNINENTGEVLSSLDVGVEEVPARKDGQDTKVNETITVDRRTSPGQPSPRAGRGSRRKAA